MAATVTLQENRISMHATIWSYQAVEAREGRGVGEGGDGIEKNEVWDSLRCIFFFLFVYIYSFANFLCA